MQDGMTNTIQPDEIINGRFVVHSPIGQGGFGQVLLVYDREIREICALKKIRPELTSVKDIQDKFAKEAKIWMEFEKHPNIVNVRTVDFFNGCLFLALEFIPPNEIGVNTLDKVLEKSRVSLATALKWGIEICIGMTYAISRGMIAHRDLKPSNLMIDPNDTLQITDFGLAIFSIAPSNRFIDSSPSGTPTYMPPEQFLPDAKLDHRSDIYSFGIILYEMITGDLPFRVERTDPKNYFSYFYNLHRSFELQHFDSPVFPIIAKCLEKDRASRYQSFEQIGQELRNLYFKITGSHYKEISKEEMEAADHNNYAVSYSLLGDSKSAMRHIEKCLEIAPYFMPAYNNKASLLAQSGKAEEAMSIWREMTVKAPSLGRPYYNLGNGFMHKGDIQSAIEHFKKALEREPDYIPAIVNMAICYQNINDVESAMRLYDRAIKISPNDAQLPMH